MEAANTNREPAQAQKLTPRQELLVRAFLNYLQTAAPGVAGAEEFQSLKVDPDKVDLGLFYKVPGLRDEELGKPYVTIHEITEGPGEHKFQDETIYNLASNELGVTYSWGLMSAPLAGSGGDAHRRLKIGFNEQLESLERKIYGVWMS